MTNFTKASDNVIMNSKVLAANVIDANTSAQWYNSRLYYETVIDSNKVWAEVDRLKALPADDRTAASTHATANTDLINDLSVTGVQLTPVTGTNATTWVAYQTYDDPSSERIDGWIQPQLIPQANGSPSNGYSAYIYYNGDATTGTYLDGADGIGVEADGFKSVAWFFNYAMGLFLIEEDFVNSLGLTEDSEIWVYGFTYNGEVGGSGSSAGESLPYCTIHDATITDPLGALVLERNLLEPLDPGITRIVTEASEVTLSIAWERPTEAGLGFSSVLPSINGTAIESNDIISTNMFDKVLYAEVPYNTADGDITLEHNGETTIIQVVTVPKPTADITFSLPMLPWDAAAEQDELKDGDTLSVIVNNASEDLDMVKIIGGDNTVYVTSSTLENAETILTTDVDFISNFIIDNTHTGNVSLEIYVRAATTKAWSLPTIYGVAVDNIDPKPTYTITYPTDQLALKDNETVSISATGGDWDTATIVYSGNVDSVLDPVNFTADDVNGTWNITSTGTAAVLTGSYRYVDLISGVVTYRKSNGMEVTQDVSFKVSNEYPVPTIPTDQIEVKAYGPATMILNWDQPVHIVDKIETESVGNTGNIIKNGDGFIDGTSTTFTFTRNPLTRPMISDLTIMGLEGPSKLPPGPDIVISDILVYNGTNNLPIMLPSGSRSATVDLMIDLTNFNTTFEFEWDGTETVQLTPVFDPLKKNAITAEKEIYIEQEADGRMFFNIIFSDTTILQTILRIRQAGI